MYVANDDARPETMAASPAAASPLGWYHWYIASLLAVGQLIAGLDRYLMSVVLEPVKADLILSDSELGLLTGTSFAIIFCVASIPLGLLADRGNRRFIVVFGIGSWSIATIACGFANSFWGLFVARVGVGLGEASLLPAAVSLISSYFPRDRLTKGLSVFTMGNSLGRAAAFLGGGLLLQLLIARGGLAIPGVHLFKPWQGVMIFAGLLGLAVAALCLTIREPKRHATAMRGDFGAATRWFWQHRGTYLRIFVLYGLLVGNAMALSTWTISLFARKYDVPVGQASLIVGIISLIVGPIANFGGGVLTDRLARRTASPGLLMGAWILGLTPILGLGFTFLPTLGFAIATYFAIYFIGVAAGPPFLSALQLVTPPHNRGVISSFYLGTYSFIGFGMTPLLVGVLTDLLSSDGGAINISLTVSFFLVAIIGVPLALSGRRKFNALAAQVHD